MPDVTISYKNTNIAALSATGTKTLLTEGKYCEDDIVVSFIKTAGSATTPDTNITANPTVSVNQNTGEITASVSASQSVTPTIVEGYVSDGTSGTISISGSSTNQLSTQEGTTITPTESVQTVVTANKYTLGDVKVGAISSSYIGSAVERRSASDTHRVGNYLAMPAGYYPENVTAEIPVDTYISSSTWYLDANNILVM